MDLPVDYQSLDWAERKSVRLEYVRRQDGVCCFCKGTLSDEPPADVLSKEIKWKLFPKNFLKYPVHLHHSHETGMTIGAVHSYCNAVLWQYHGE